MAGVAVADALRHWSPIELFLALNRQVVWPFVHSLMLAPAFLVAGPSIAAAEATSVILYAATIVLLFVAGTQLHPTRGAWVGLACATLALVAPAWGFFGTVAMLEMPGALLLLAAFALHARAARAPLAPRRLAAAGLATTALFLCKYNYGLMWLVPLVFWEWALMPGEFRAPAWSALRARVLAPRWWLRPMPLLFGAGAFAIAAILVTGGAEFPLLGRRVSLHSPGNLAYTLWLAWLAWWFVPRRVTPKAAADGAAPPPATPRRESRAAWAWARLPERARILTRTIAVPLAIWFTLPYPNRVRELLGFLANRDSGVPFWTREGLLFYPRALAADYSPAAWVAIVALALALIPPLRRRAGDAMRLAWLAFAVGLVATVVHPYRDSRFLFTVTPLLWMCAAARAVEFADALLRRVPARAGREAAWLAAAAGVLAAAWLAAPSAESLRPRRAAFRSPARFAPALDAVLDATAASTRDDPRTRLVLLGYSNVLSPGLLAWRARLAHPDWNASRLPKRAPFLDPGDDESALAARLDWIEAHADRVIVALDDSVSAAQRAEYQRETWADRESVERMREDRERWRPDSTRVVDGARVEVFGVGARP